MAHSSAFCLTQETFQRERAAKADLENVRVIATKAAVAWAREAELAQIREAKTGREEKLPKAASLSEEEEDDLADDEADNENPDNDNAG